MKLLFRIATNRFTLDWHRVRDQDPDVLAQGKPVVGRLQLTPHAKDLRLLDTTKRVGFPTTVASDIGVTVGPALYEQVEYQLYLRVDEAEDTVEIRHRDPNITSTLNAQEQGRVVHGSVNFRGQIGRSLFSIYVNGDRCLDFEVEVFPTKIDYQSDYRDIVADVQAIQTSLAYEYLRSTHQLGKLSAQSPSKLEWFVLVEHIFDELEAAMNQIAHRPTRGLVRREQTTRIERVRRVDARLRSQVRRGQGRGAPVALGNLVARQQLIHRPAELTLDTTEHRWLRKQLLDLQRSLRQLYAAATSTEQPTPRHERMLESMNRLSVRTSRLLQLEPIRAADGEPPPGFASLQLVSAPGYRNAYRLLMRLKMGLRLEGELFKLALKDLEVLYEYWTYLTVVRIVQEELGPPNNLESMFRISSGLAVRLIQGASQQAEFRSGRHRVIRVKYNPRFSNHDAILITQKPDILIEFEEDGWPAIQLVADAKYRVDASLSYREQFGSAGPPTDAINALHRYRDAIMEFEDRGNSRSGPNRTVVQAAALFPLSHDAGDSFRDSRLWRGLQRLGIGAIPALPTNCELLKEWLLSSMRLGGWAMADRSISHAVNRKARDWRIAASEPVFIGTLRAPGGREHLDWIIHQRCYYHPFAKTQARQYKARSIAIYVPASFDGTAGIRYVAEIERYEIVDRHSINTPWPARRRSKAILYHLGEVEKLQQPVLLRSGDHMPAQGRWASRLSLERARSISETALETEPEWRLLEWLRASGIQFNIRLNPPRVNDADNPKGRAWFVLATGESIRFDGVNGFLCRRPDAEPRFYSLQQLRDLWPM